MWSRGSSAGSLAGAAPAGPSRTGRDGSGRDRATEPATSDGTAQRARCDRQRAAEDAPRGPRRVARRARVSGQAVIRATRCAGESSAADQAVAASTSSSGAAAAHEPRQQDRSRRPERRAEQHAEAQHAGRRRGAAALSATPPTPPARAYRAGSPSHRRATEQRLGEDQPPVAERAERGPLAPARALAGERGEGAGEPARPSSGARRRSQRGRGRRAPDRPAAGPAAAAAANSSSAAPGRPVTPARRSPRARPASQTSRGQCEVERSPGAGHGRGRLSARGSDRAARHARARSPPLAELRSGARGRRARSARRAGRLRPARALLERLLEARGSSSSVPRCAARAPARDRSRA